MDPDTIVSVTWMNGDLETEIQAASETNARVLISGEGSVARRLAADTIHQQSRRRSKPFVVINGVDFEQVHLESARGGTLLMQEIENVPMADQERLNGFIEAAAAPENDVRLMVATSVQLHDRVAAGTFREDVFYRLNILHLMIPPVRVAIGPDARAPRLEAVARPARNAA